MSQRKARPALAAWLVCFAFAAALLLLCTGTSPLYNGHDWTDANTYLTMARGLLQGSVPYRDLFDHKGPLLYFVYALGVLISPSGFLGVFLLQTAALGTTLFFFYRTALLLLGDSPRAAVCAAAVPLFLLTAGIYYLPANLDYGGGSAEEFCFPLMAAALWLSARCEVRERWSRGSMLAMGVLAGCVCLIKFNLVLFWVGLLLPVFLRLLAGRQWREFCLSALWGLAGAMIPLIPYLLYGVATGSLDDFFYAYIQFNRAYAVTGSLPRLVWNTVMQAYRNLVSIPILLLALIALLLGLLFLRRAPVLWRVSVFLAFGGLGVAVFCGRTMLYTLLPLLLAVFPGAVALTDVLTRRVGRSPSAFGAAVLCLVLGGAAVVNNQMIFHKDFFWSNTPTCQEQIAALVRSGPYEDPTLLEAGMLNRGYYNELDLIPTVYYFYLPNVTYAQCPEILDSQLAAIQEEETDYVVLQSSLAELSSDSLPKEEIQARLCLAALEHYQLVDVVKGTGAVDHLYYHLFVRR